MANDDLVPPELPKQEIPPTDTSDPQTVMENSSVENQSHIPVIETADQENTSQDNPSEPPKKLRFQEIPPGDQENSSLDNPSDLEESKEGDHELGDAFDEYEYLLLEAKNADDTVGLRLRDVFRVYDALYKDKIFHLTNSNAAYFDKYQMIFQQNDQLLKMMEHQRVEFLKQNTELQTKQEALKKELLFNNASLQNLVILYGAARSVSKRDDVDISRLWEDEEAFDANIKALREPRWIKNELSSLLEERENREALDANLKKLILMLKIASTPVTPDRYDTSTLGEQTIAEELKPYATELNEVTQAFRDKFDWHTSILTGNRRIFDANIKKLITMLRITVKLEPFPDTPDGYDAFTINAETMAEEIKPYAAELDEITNSIKSKQFESVKPPLAGTQKKKSFWAWLSAAVAAASMAYVAGSQVFQKLKYQKRISREPVGVETRSSKI